MNDHELKKLWQQQPLRDPALSPAQVMSAMQNKTTQLRRTLLARDMRELLACVIVGVIFGIYFFINRAPIARLGALITVAAGHSERRDLSEDLSVAHQPHLEPPRDWIAGLVLGRISPLLDR